jgi:serine/threonine protein kinase
MRAFLPWSAPAGETCVSFVDIDFTSDNLYASHVDTGASDALGGFPHVLVIAAVIFCACCLYAARRYMLRVARIFRGWRHYPQATVFSQRVFSTCKHIALVGVGAQSEVYMSEITVWGKTRQIASKMYYRQANAKAEMVMYERLPFHENILRVHGVFADTVMNNRWCLAMEYCRHGNVRESMRSGKFPRNGGFAHHLISGVVSALGALHGNAMAHRDVKLDNVLLHCPCEGSSACACLSTNSRDVRAKLADFGMARQGTMMAMSSANVKGTLMYIPPERVQYDKSKHGEGFYELADVYALGMMIWETLYYVRHGEVVSVMEKILPGCREGQDVLIAISSGAFTPPCDFLPEPLRRFLRKSWHFSPSERYQRCACMDVAWEEMRDTVCALSFGADDVAVDATRGERAASEKG